MGLGNENQRNSTARSHIDGGIVAEPCADDDT